VSFLSIGDIEGVDAPNVADPVTGTRTKSSMISQNLFSLAGKTALITGGSRGLGLQIAEALGDHGARLIISSRKAGDLESARDHLKARGIEVAFMAADNARDEDIQRLADRSIAELGRVDILVNNAGATEQHPRRTIRQKLGTS
jgi:NAD(P)-dependent dehydrogenase (short-subunit alcohol dehydrogenase family)